MQNNSEKSTEKSNEQLVKQVNTNITKQINNIVFDLWLIKSLIHTLMV